MTDEYKVTDILEAVDTLLNNNEKPFILVDKKEKPLELTNEVKNLKKETQDVPKDTEKIILQAEEYIKK